MLDPREGIDAPHDVLVRDGAIAELGAPGALEAPEGAEVLDGEGRHLFPGFVDPHVHLRVPGQEHKEDLDSGTRAAAAGGFVAVVAMPNTDPTVDDATVLRSLREAARREARIPVGFMACDHPRPAGRGADRDGRAARRGRDRLHRRRQARRTRPNMLRKALQYQRLCGGVLALHEEDPSLSGAGVMHEGVVSARLGLAGIPSISESTMIARDAAIAGYEEGRIHIQHLSARESVAAIAEAKARGVRITAEASPHHLTLTHEAILERLDTRLKMNPPLREEDDRQALIEGLRDGTIDCIATDHAPHAREEKEVPFEQAPMGTTGLETSFAAVYTELVVPGVLPLGAGRPAALRRRRAARPAGAADRGRRAGRRRASSTSRRAGRSARPATSRARRTAASPAARCAGRVLATVAGGSVVYRERAFALSAA